jgi:hypothetical protein
MEIDPVSKTPCSLEYRTMDKVQKPSNPEAKTTYKYSLQTLRKCNQFQIYAKDSNKSKVHSGRSQAQIKIGINTCHNLILNLLSSQLSMTNLKSGIYKL